jgi:hypothetical protein
VLGEQTGDFGGGEASYGAEDKDDTQGSGKAFEPVTETMIVRTGEHLFELGGGDTDGVEIVILNATDGTGFGGRSGESGDVVCREQADSLGAESQTGVMSGLDYIFDCGEIELGDDLLGQADALFPFAKKHRGDAIEVRSDRFEMIFPAKKSGFGDGVLRSQGIFGRRIV